VSESTELRRHEKSVALNCPVDEGQNLIAIVRRKKNGHQIAIVDRAIREGYSVIRGLHFTEDDPPRRDNHREVPENAPPGGDILNPESVACFIRLVYQRYYDEFKEHFGKTVQAIFTDEPSFLARRGERGAMPGTTDILEHVSSHLGYDFSPCLPALWYSDEPDVGPNSAWWNDQMEDSELRRRIDRLVPVDVRVRPAKHDLRVRHVFKNGADFYIVFNEGQDNLEVELETSAKGRRFLLDPQTSRQQILLPEAPLLLKPHELRVLMVTIE